MDFRTTAPSVEVYRTVRNDTFDGRPMPHVRVAPLADAYRVVGEVRPTRIIQATAFILPLVVPGAVTGLVRLVRDFDTSGVVVIVWVGIWIWTVVTAPRRRARAHARLATLVTP